MSIIDRVEGITDATLHGMTPGEVDEMLGELHRQVGALSVELERLGVSVYQAAGATHRRDKGWSLSWGEALRIAGEKGSATAGAYGEALAKRERAWAAMHRLDGEYQRRGRWTRAFLVTDGHVHRFQSCSTCNKGERPTEFDWLYELSGQTEEEIVSQGGGRRVCPADRRVRFRGGADWGFPARLWRRGVQE